MRFETLLITKDTIIPKGTVLAHSKILPSSKIDKGTPLTKEHLTLLLENNSLEVIVAIPEVGDIDENEAAKNFAEIISHDNLIISRPLRGRANIYAQEAGILTINEGQLIFTNGLDEAISIATLPPFTPVLKGQLIATTKIIPFFLNNKIIEGAQSQLKKINCFEVKPFKRKSIHIIFTQSPAQKKSVYEKGKDSTLKRIRKLGLDIENFSEIPHSRSELVAEITNVNSKKPDCVLILSAIATTDRGDLIPKAILEAGGHITRFGLPADPGNLTILANIKNIPIIGLPGCARSTSLNGFDWVLERTLADIPISKNDIAKMGIGGLFKEMPNRPDPREPRKRKGSSHKKNVGLILLAAGRSKRMGPKNKLLEPIAGKPMIKHTLDKIAKISFEQKIIVLGHEAARLKEYIQISDYDIVNNLDYKDGISTSINKGIKALNKSINAVFIILADMPMVQTKTLEALIDAFQNEDDKTIFIPCWDGKKGNPVLLEKSIFNDLLCLDGDKGAQQLFPHFQDKIKEIEVDDSGACLDIDTLQALENFNNQ